MASTINAAVGGIISSADASGELALQASGSTVATLTASGNVGIGTSSPAYKLQMTGTLGFRANSTNIAGMYGSGFGYSVSSYPAVVIGSTGTQSIALNYDPVINLNGGFSGDGSEIVVRNGAQFITPNVTNNAYYRWNLVLKDGNVGIGISTPSQKLDVRRESYGVTARFISEDGSRNPRLVVYGSADGTTLQNTFSASAASIMFAIGGAEGAGTEVARFNASGNLLVGTTTDVSGLTGVISDVNGNVRAIPQSGSAKTTSYTLVKGDVGEFINIGSGGSVVVPDSVFATGDVVSIFNNTSGNVTLTMSITTAYIGGTDADKATITLATRGIATILFISGTVCVVNGNVS